MKTLLPLLLLLGVTACASKKNLLIPLPGFEGLSGLAVESQTSEELIFWSHTDRGPNADALSGNRRPFLDPSFQPYWVKFAVNLKTKQVRRLEKISLGLPGLPNKSTDELPVTLEGKPLARTPQGIDPESLCFDGQHVWMGEEYGPSLLKFTLQGVLVKRYFPGSGLPKRIETRTLNRGFEGIACGHGRVYAILQSPLPNEKNVLLLEFNPVLETTEREFSYPLTVSGDGKIGDLFLKGDLFYVIEQNGKTGPSGQHDVYTFRLNGPILQKSHHLDLVKAGFDFADKLEGLSVLDDGSIAVVNDNDFGLQGAAASSKQTFLGVFHD